jgi:hypothetical protein
MHSLCIINVSLAECLRQHACLSHPLPVWLPACPAPCLPVPLLTCPANSLSSSLSVSLPNCPTAFISLPACPVPCQSRYLPVSLPHLLLLPLPLPPVPLPACTATWLSHCPSVLLALNTAFLSHYLPVLFPVCHAAYLSHCLWLYCCLLYRCLPVLMSPCPSVRLYPLVFLSHPSPFRRPVPQPSC